MTNLNIMSYPWENHEFYTKWLAQTFFYVRHSTRLTSLAAGHCDFTEVGQVWHERFVEHSREERGHERLAAQDLAVLGYDVESDFVEFMSTRRLYSGYYYTNEPHLLMGYILALEETAAEFGPALLPVVKAAHGSKTTHFLAVHAKDDVEHVSAAHELVEMLPLAKINEVYESKRGALEAYKRLLENCAGR